MRNVVERVLAAYEATGVLPTRELWQNHDHPDVVYACGLGVLMYAKGRHRINGEYGPIMDVLGLPIPYIQGFVSGFDGDTKKDLQGELFSYLRMPTFWRAWADGRRAWRESRKLRRQWVRGERPIAIRRGIARAWAGIARGVLAKEREIVAVGLEELGGTYAYAAREAGIVDAALAEARALVAPTTSSGRARAAAARVYGR